MKLYGTTTSPYVRRVTVAATEVGITFELVNTAPDAGQAALREVSPIRKVPVAVVDGRTIYDSRVIIDWMVTTRGWGALTPSRDRWHEQNIINAIDGAADSIIQLFYLRRDGVAVDGSTFAQRQLDRADAIFNWLGTQLTADKTSFTGGFGLAEIALITTLDWIDFRKPYPIERASAVESVRTAWKTRPSLAATLPRM